MIDRLRRQLAALLVGEVREVHLNNGTVVSVRNLGDRVELRAPRPLRVTLVGGAAQVEVVRE